MLCFDLNRLKAGLKTFSAGGSFDVAKNTDDWIDVDRQRNGAGANAPARPDRDRRRPLQSVLGSGQSGRLLPDLRRPRHGVSNVMLRQSSDGVNFSAPVRVNDHAGDATVRNENPPKV